MRKQLLQLSFIALALIFISGCGKDKDDPAPAKTKTELISTGTWKFSSAKAGTTDVSGFLQVCQKDNIYTFVASGTGTINEGTTKCNAGDPQTSPFTWNFASGETILHISTTLFTGGGNDFTLVSLTETELVGSQNYPPYGTIVVTFVH